MRPSARTTYLLIATLTIPFALFLWWTEADLRPRLELEVEESLAHQARLMHATIGTQAFSASLADALGEASGSRVTLIDRTGRVVGDSEVSGDRLPEVENHAARPEVAAALQGRKLSLLPFSLVLTGLSPDRSRAPNSVGAARLNGGFRPQSCSALSTCQ